MTFKFQLKLRGLTVYTSITVLLHNKCIFELQLLSFSGDIKTKCERYPIILGDPENKVAPTQKLNSNSANLKDQSGSTVSQPQV